MTKKYELPRSILPHLKTVRLVDFLKDRSDGRKEKRKLSAVLDQGDDARAIGFLIEESIVSLDETLGSEMSEEHGSVSFIKDFVEAAKIADANTSAL